MIYNYLTKPQEVEVTLHNKLGDLQFVQANAEDGLAVGNSSRSIGPTSPLQRKKLVRVSADSVAAVSFLVACNRLGEVNLKVSAASSLAGDSVVRSLKVKAEGQIHYENEARLLHLMPSGVSLYSSAASNESKSASTQAVSPTSVHQIKVVRPADAVVGSSVLRLSLLGDLLGSTMHHLTDLVRLPYGCGEQNMIHFVPNILVMEYLQRSNRLTSSMKEKLLSHMQIGYQTELSFRRNDGSFSAFGAADSQGSTWLTAFVLRSFLLARPFLSHLDVNVTNQAAHWLVERQLSDGSFDEPGEVHFKPLQGSTGDGQAPLTAFVCIALSEDSTLAARYAHQIRRAERFLVRHVQLEQTRSVHELSLIAFTLNRLHSDSAANVFNRLWQLRQSDSDRVWWTSTAVKRRTSTVSETSALDVEASSYALLTLVQRQDVARALPILTWLVAQQNANGGFQSTQDTVVGLQAMAALAEKLSSSTNRLQVRFRLRYSAPEAEQLVEMQVNADTALQMQSFELADGDWCALPADQRTSESSTDNAVCRGQSAFNDLTTNRTDEQCAPNALRLTNRLPVEVHVESSGVGSAIAQVSWQYNLVQQSKEKSAFRMHYELEQNAAADGYLQLNVCGS
jgi:CD109 antigen